MDRAASELGFYERRTFSISTQWKVSAALSAFFAIGVLLLVAGYLHYSLNWVHVTGTVTSAEWKEVERQSKNGSYTVKVVTFGYVAEAADGTIIEGSETQDHIAHLSVEPGQQIEILHAPGDAGNHMSQYALSGLFMLMGMFALMAMSFGGLSLWLRTKALAERSRAV